MRHIGHLAAGLFLTVWAASVRAEPTKEEAADGKVILAYVKDNKLDETWHGQPTRLDTEEIRKAYPGYRAYHTFAAPPVRRIGGAAPSHQELERDRRAEQCSERRGHRLQRHFRHALALRAIEVRE